MYNIPLMGDAIFYLVRKKIMVKFFHQTIFVYSIAV